MLGKKFQRFERTKANIFGKTAARAQVAQCDPGVLRIPDNRRKRADNENREQPIQTRSFEFLSQPRGKREHEQHANDLKRVRITTQKSETDQQSGQRPPKRKLRTFFSGEPEGKHCRHPKEDRQRIRRDYERTDVENGRDIERDHGPETDIFVKQAPPEIKKKQTCAGGKNRAPETHTELGRAKEHRAGANRKRDARTFTEITRRETLRPHPVMRFI